MTSHARAKCFQTFHAMGMLLNSLPLPRTNIEWAQTLADAETLANNLKIKRTAYRWQWLLRTYIFAEMRHHGVYKLRIVEDWNADQLQEAIKPDQNQWLSTWMSSLAGNSLNKLLNRLEFKESLEMLSVFTCIMNDSAMMEFDFEHLKKNENA